MLEQGALSLRAVWKGVGPGEVAQRVFRVLPFLSGYARILAVWNPMYCLRWNTLVALFHSCAERSGGRLGVVDVSAFLADADGWDDVEIAPLDATIAVHDPCTLRNGLRSAIHAGRGP